MKAIFQTAVFLLVMCVVLTGTLVFMLYVTKAGTPSVQSQNLPFNWEQRVQSAVDLEELKQQCRVFAKFRDMDDLTRRVQEKWMSNVFTYGIAFAIGWGLFFGLHLAYIVFRLRKMQGVRGAPL
jgi:hypothetical protein